MKVMFISVGYMSTQMASDKQYVRELLTALPAKINCVVWTINDWPVSVTHEVINGQQVSVYSSSRLLHKPRYDLESVLQKKYSYTHHPAHGRFRQIAELTSSIIWHLPYLRRIVKRERPDVLHVTDNLGPIVWLLRWAIPHVPITCNRVGTAFHEEGGKFYSAFLCMCDWCCDLTICNTDACAKQFSAAGVPRTRLLTIPWGINVPEEASRDEEMIARIRQRYGCQKGDLLVVASPQALTGLLQAGPGMTDMLNELEEISHLFPMRCVVAVKPDHWTSDMEKFRTESIMLEQGPSDFLDLLWASDIMFSPTYSRFRKSTATPPLAWLEAMARQTALITTFGHGVEETVVDGQTGIVYTSTSELVAKMHRMMENNRLEKMKKAARRMVIRRHSIEHIATIYSRIWTNLRVDNKKTIMNVSE